HRRKSLLPGAAARAVGKAGSGGPRRRAVAAALREAGGRAAARPAVATESAYRPPHTHEAADRDRPCREEGGGARRARALEDPPPGRGLAPPAGRRAGRRHARPFRDVGAGAREPRARARAATASARSEEHTSELQSRVDLVCRL